MQNQISVLGIAYSVDTLVSNFDQRDLESKYINFLLKGHADKPLADKDFMKGEENHMIFWVKLLSAILIDKRLLVHGKAHYAINTLLGIIHCAILGEDKVVKSIKIASAIQGLVEGAIRDFLQAFQALWEQDGFLNKQEESCSEFCDDISEKNLKEMLMGNIKYLSLSSNQKLNL
jgi:hypothetical protein